MELTHNAVLFVDTAIITMQIVLLFLFRWLVVKHMKSMADFLIALDAKKKINIDSLVVKNIEFKD